MGALFVLSVDRLRPAPFHYAIDKCFVTHPNRTALSIAEWNGATGSWTKENKEVPPMKAFSGYFLSENCP